MELYTRVLVVLLLSYLFALPVELGGCDGQSLQPVCRKEEREALLSFKNGIQDPWGRLSSWVGDECCTWEGVRCHNTTGRVLKLNLRGDPSINMSSPLGGEISSSLLELKHLRHLDLSSNDFGEITIPKFLGSISNLRYLNLSQAYFGGVILHQLGNLSKLHYLDIAVNPLYADDLEWISGLTLLQFIDMSYVDLSKASSWLQVMNKLPSLSVLRLFFCDLKAIDSLPHVNFSSLAILDLSANHFSSVSLDWFANLSSLIALNLSTTHIQGPIPSGVHNMTSLRYLDLSSNFLVSPIPKWLFHMTTLEHLDLGWNLFQGENLNDIRNLTSVTYLDLSDSGLKGDDILLSLTHLCTFQLTNFSSYRPQKALEILSLSENELFGSLPSTLGGCKSLKRLELRWNNLSGQIPISLGGISSLRSLDIRNNFFVGILTEKHFANLTSLKELSASSNKQLSLQVSSNWTPPFQLSLLDLGSWHLGPQCPAWLQTQHNLKVLNMSDAGISSAMPAWFWAAPCFETVLLSHNKIPDPLPQISSSLVHLDLSSNLFRGPLSSMLCQGNREFINSLSHLDISGNFLSGEIPDCWMYWRELYKLNLGDNNLTGYIPSSMGSLTFLCSLHLRNNYLSGNFPLPLKNCVRLLVIDLSENEFTGSIPAWIGNFYGKSPVQFHDFSLYIMGLKVLVLHSNKFNGSIPRELCRLDSLQILDLGNNNLCGTIPRCFGNFSRMSKPLNNMFTFGFSNEHSSSLGGYDMATLVVKGAEYEYGKALGLLVGIDLSSNKLFGGIPEELTALHGLIFLNLSHNHFQGKIPNNIGDLTSLQSLDLSMNRLYGVIPQGLATISFLDHLNLSYNKLSGKIPTGTQIQGFTPLSFMGNPELCGPPLSDDHACAEDVKPKAPTPNKAEEEYEDGWIDMKWLYFGMAWGFVVGFWGILGPLILSRAWRHAYFERLDGIKHKLLGWWL